MAILVTCPTCGGAMSSNALTCPHCGETEFTECVYKNLKCEYCNGNKVISRTNTIYKVHQETLDNFVNFFESLFLANIIRRFRPRNPLYCKCEYGKRQSQNILAPHFEVFYLYILFLVKHLLYLQLFSLET